MADRQIIKWKSFAFYSNVREFQIEIATYFDLHDPNRLKRANDL